MAVIRSRSLRAGMVLLVSAVTGCGDGAGDGADAAGAGADAAAPDAAEQLAPGTLDPSFGIDGVFEGQGFFDNRGMAIAADGTIVAAGDVQGAVGADLGVIKVTPTGSTDQRFGPGGAGEVALDLHHDDFTRSMVLGPDGTIWIRAIANLTETSEDPVIVRVRGDGAIDDTFADQGRLALPFDGLDFEVVPGGGPVHAGHVEGSQASRLAVEMRDADGGPATDFGVNGRVVVRAGARLVNSFYDHIVTGPDWILVAAHDFGGPVLFRFDLRGALDETFGDRGIAHLDIPTSNLTVDALAVQPDGAILVAFEQVIDQSGVDLGLARLHPDGTFDATFGAGGITTTDFGSFEVVAALAVDAQQRLVVLDDVGPERQVLARYLPDGSLDPTFGDGGSVEVQVPIAIVRSLALDASGGILVGGVGEEINFALARYAP